jgi:hypothetical protein
MVAPISLADADRDFRFSHGLIPALVGVDPINDTTSVADTQAINLRWFIK